MFQQHGMMHVTWLGDVLMKDLGTHWLFYCTS